jgi:hypothetical protein
MMCVKKLVLIALTFSSFAVSKGGELKPGESVDYGKMSFNPGEWTKKKVDPMLLPWEGSNVVFLTTKGDFDHALMAKWVANLDGGWQVYSDLTGRKPGPFKQLHGKPTIAAVPDYGLTCGAGCGYIGVSGIELAMFYDRNYPDLKKNPDAMPHYAFYEMGRNFYTFGDRHSCFITGYAVFMRYVCMDALGCHDNEIGNRHTIERAESLHAKGTMSFLKCFTNADGLSEKEPRVKLPDGKWLQPSDQPVTYASAMLRLRRECGGDEWLKRFFAELATCPESKRDTRDGALAQCWHWYLCCSVAAHRDLANIFCDEWRMPLMSSTREALKKVSWDRADLRAADVAKQIAPEWN